MTKSAIDKQALIRLNLEFYSLTDFAEKLKKKGYLAFFPFRDIGMDIIAKHENKDKFFVFQVKTRNLHKGNYSFSIKKKDLQKLTNINNMYWVFGVVKKDRNIDYFIISHETLQKWIKQGERNPNNKILLYVKSRRFWRFDIKRNKDGGYIVKPKKGGKDITPYLITNKKHPDIKW